MAIAHMTSPATRPESATASNTGASEAGTDELVLDITLIESAAPDTMINLTDDGCGPSCPTTCTTSAAD